MRKTFSDYLNRECTEPIRDPLWKNILLPKDLLPLLTLPAVQKLQGIKQLGPTYLVYPGAVHSRFMHSLGVFHLGKRLFSALLMKDEGPQFSLEGVKAFLAACLFHDLGHYPFAHSLKELPVKAHEALTGELLRSGELYKCLKEKSRIDPSLVAAIVDESLPIEGNEEISFFRGLLSGVLDPDKLDYLNRDAYFCGVPYGVQDVDFIISKCVHHPFRGMALSPAGISAVENLLFSKYLMYRTVYWHKTVRIATAMIKKAIYSGLKVGVLTTDMLYFLDDNEFYHNFGKGDFPGSALIDMVFHRHLYKVVYETTFDESEEIHRRLLSLEERALAEAKLAETLSLSLSSSLTPEDVIIDIPEKISFEVDLPIGVSGDTFIDFSRSQTVFTPPLVSGFTKTIRKLRIICPPSIVDRVPPGETLLAWIS